MKSDIIAVSSRGQGIDAALALADSTAEQLALGHREALHLRLLVEEMMSMMRSIIGGLEGQFWIETEGDMCRLVLKAKSLMDTEQRKQLISAASSGKNKAHQGFMGKLRAFFEPLPLTESPAYLEDTYLPEEHREDLIWSLEAYKARLAKRRESSDGDQEAWDELEKSVVTHIADNVEVSIHGYDVELAILKRLNRA